MILYRAIYHNQNIRLDKLGIHFSASPQYAYPYGATRILGKRPKSYYLYICQIRACDIDPILTGINNKIWPHEQEIAVMEGIDVEVIQVVELEIKYQSIINIHYINFKTKT